GWFYTTDNVDIAVDKVKGYRMFDEKNGLETREIQAVNNNIGGDSTLSIGTGTFFFEGDKNPYKEFMGNVDGKAIKEEMVGKFFYEVTFKNNGGLVMPLIIEWTYADGSKELEQLPAEVWRKNEEEITKVFVKEQEVTNLVLDPFAKTADVNIEDNIYPRKRNVSRFDKFKGSR
ncbi:MAG: M1 family peptidase, partial [Cyclobacteriaceae bacterium]|nr:M1 family peptidase [Cyclobacteriaceae bacterium HetDA_MAG_MS6]